MIFAKATVFSLLSFLSLSSAAETVSVQLEVSGAAYEVNFQPENEPVADVARSFCIRHADTLGYTSENPLTDDNIAGCVNPIATYLQQAVAKGQQEKAPAAGLFVTQMTVGANTYEISFRPESEPVTDVARNFCIRHADSLGYSPENPLTDANVADCIDPIANYLRQSFIQAQQQQQQQQQGAQGGELFKTQMTVGENVYQVSFRPTSEPVTDVARNFCIRHAVTLGYTAENPLTDNNLAGCVNPIATFLQQAILKDQQEKAARNPLAVRLTISGATFEVTFRPETERVTDVARNFCIRQADALGYTPEKPLTEENIGDCVNPVANYLQQQAASVGRTLVQTL